LLFSPGSLPRVGAVVGANFSLAFVLVPLSNPPPVVHAISATLVAIGAAGSIWALSYLGRAFAILPQVRQLTMRGPYAFVRHPLYLVEMIGMIGVMLQFRQPWALLIVAATLAFQLARIRYEERLLEQTFPDYRAYPARTARLIPGVY
jgi:protein-S-isoprenylcysteine O-methyltransferase Ste14